MFLSRRAANNAIRGHLIHEAGSGNLFIPFSINGAGWMTSGPVFLDIENQIANAGNAFVFPPGNLPGDEPMFTSLSASHAAAPIASPAAGNILGDEPMFASLLAPHAVAPIASPAAPPTTAPTLPLQPAQRRFPCTQARCVETFARDADRVRHEKSTHFAQYGAHRCPIAGCRKSYGAGYSRPDKVKEHLRKTHGVQGKA